MRITEAAGLRHGRTAATSCSPRCASCPTRWPRSSPTAPAIAEAARRFAPSKRYWAIVGNGPNVVAAEEVRIKLSELCYKSIACDVTEDKKHIDLSSEPLILVCAAGLVGGTADDVAKEVAIYKAHKATPIVIATEADERFAARRRGAHRAAGRLRRSPSCCRRWSATCSATRRRWPSTRRPARCARRARSIEHALAATRRRRRRCCARCSAGVGRRTPRSSSTGCAPARYDGHLEASTAVRLVGAAARRRQRLAARGVPAGHRQGRHARAS